MENIEMSDEITSITGTQVGDGVTPVTPEAGGVEVSAGTQTEAMPTTETSDVDWKARFEELSAKTNKDINAMKSSLQRQAEQDKRALKTEYEKQLAETRMSTMDDKQKKQYMEQVEKQQQQQMAQQLQEYRHMAEEQQSITQTFTWLLQQGIPADKLDVSQGLNGLSDGGWNYIIDENKRLRNELARLQGQPVTTTGQKPTPPPTAQHQTGAPKGKMTLAEFAKAYGGGNLEAAYEHMESHPELNIQPPE
jgi:hypothetical protein